MGPGEDAVRQPMSAPDYIRIESLEAAVVDAWVEAGPSGSLNAIKAELALLTALRAAARERINETRMPALDQYVAAHPEALRAEQVAPPPEPAPPEPPAAEPDPAPPAPPAPFVPPNDDEDLPPP